MCYTRNHLYHEELLGLLTDTFIEGYDTATAKYEKFIPHPQTTNACSFSTQFIELLLLHLLTDTTNDKITKAFSNIERYYTNYKAQTIKNKDSYSDLEDTHTIELSLVYTDLLKIFTAQVLGLDYNTLKAEYSYISNSFQNSYGVNNASFDEARRSSLAIKFLDLLVRNNIDSHVIFKRLIPKTK